MTQCVECVELYRKLCKDMIKLAAEHKYGLRQLHDNDLHGAIQATLAIKRLSLDIVSDMLKLILDGLLYHENKCLDHVRSLLTSVLMELVHVYNILYVRVTRSLNRHGLVKYASESRSLLDSSLNATLIRRVIRDKQDMKDYQDKLHYLSW